MAERQKKSDERNKNNISRWYIWGLRGVAVISLILAGRNLFSLYLPNIHDLTVFIWSFAYNQLAKAGWWYPLWLPQLWYGFGEPIFLFYNPLIYWLAEIPQLLGVPTTISVGLVAGLSMLWGWWWLYKWLREFVSEQAAWLGTGLFILAPYYLGLIYLRGAYPEFFALNLIPGLMWLVARWLKTGGKYYAAGLVLTWMAIILTHTLTIATAGAIYAGVILFWYVKELKPQRDLVIWSFIFPVLGLLATAFYWLPAIVNSGLINLGYMTSGRLYYAKNFPDLITLLNPARNRELSWLTLGWIQTAIVIVGWLAYREVLDPRWRRRWLVILTGMSIALFLVMPYSDFIWNWVKGLDLFQFPSRLLGPVVLLLGVAAAFMVETFIPKRSGQIAAAAGVLVLVGWINWPFGNIVHRDLTNQDLDVERFYKLHVSEELKTHPEAWSDDGMNPFEYVPRKINLDEGRALLENSLKIFATNNNLAELTDYRKVDVTSGTITIQPIEEKLMSWKYKITANTSGEIRINQFEFPNWQILLDGQPASLSVDKDKPGQRLAVSEGVHTLKIGWKNSALTIWSRVFSVLVILGLIGWLALWPKEKISRKKR